jgi:hypothetical protein
MMRHHLAVVRYRFLSHGVTGKICGLMLAEIMDILYNPAFEGKASADQGHVDVVCPAGMTFRWMTKQAQTMSSGQLKFIMY